MGKAQSKTMFQEEKKGSGGLGDASPLVNQDVLGVNLAEMQLPGASCSYSKTFPSYSVLRFYTNLGLTVQV